MDDLISIHAAREGGDYSQIGQLLYFVGFQSTPPVKAATAVYVDLPEVFHISIHAAREGGDRNTQPTFVACLLFQSTPPVKAATFRRVVAEAFGHISIHAAREGGDCMRRKGDLAVTHFNPRRP